MCGLFGAVLQKPLERSQQLRVADAVQFMAVASITRGSDSAGIARADVTDKVTLYKDIGPSDMLVRRKAWRAVLNGISEDTFALIGHTRKKTHGAITRDNAHPHLFNEPTNAFKWLVGTHNGSIADHQSYGPYENDSRNLFHTLAMSTEWGEVLRKARGTYAVVCVVPGWVVFARNSHMSPLYAGTCEALGITLYSSTEAVVKAAMAIARIGKDVYGSGLNTMYRLPARIGSADTKPLEAIQLYESELPLERDKTYSTHEHWKEDRPTRASRSFCMGCKNTFPTTDGIWFHGFFRCWPCYHTHQERVYDD